MLGAGAAALSPTYLPSTPVAGEGIDRLHQQLPGPCLVLPGHTAQHSTAERVRPMAAVPQPDKQPKQWDCSSTAASDKTKEPQSEQLISASTPNPRKKTAHHTRLSISNNAAR